ncbi:MAG: HAMP domain-containing histidine kinase [Candidatus Taylorbacteria bacterium]|nr:HAMP domain-containing histidine kinase [Candidatus Taylorbacteria bacterium]
MFSLFRKKVSIPAKKSANAGVVFCNTLLEKNREAYGSKRLYLVLRSAFEFRTLPKYVSESEFVIPSETDTESLKVIVISLVNEMVKVFGTDFAEATLGQLISTLEKEYPTPVIGAMVVPLIPAGFLEEKKRAFLSKDELAREVAEKTAELRKVNSELEKKVAERTADLQKLLAEQQNSAKLLVRRDLELTRANEKLEELDDRKSEFLSIVAHQLRTPLSGIKWTLSMIANGELGAITDEQKVFLMKSYESNERMIKLVDDMLHADRIDSGKYHLNAVKTQLLDLIDNVLYEVLPLAQKKNVHIEFDRGGGDIPAVDVDQEKLRAVFQNLLDNAIKYSHENGVVLVSAKKDADHLTFKIQDHGIGIPEDQHEHIFSRFFRARNALKQETDGTGLGLFIVKNIVERHGGTVWFETKEGRGTAFYFTIKV